MSLERILNLFEVMVVIDDFNEQYGQHPLVTDEHYYHLRNIVRQAVGPNSTYPY